MRARVKLKVCNQEILEQLWVMRWSHCHCHVRAERHGQHNTEARREEIGSTVDQVGGEPLWEAPGLKLNQIKKDSQREVANCQRGNKKSAKLSQLGARRQQGARLRPHFRSIRRTVDKERQASWLERGQARLSLVPGRRTLVHSSPSRERVRRWRSAVPQLYLRAPIWIASWEIKWMRMTFVFKVRSWISLLVLWYTIPLTEISIDQLFTSICVEGTTITDISLIKQHNHKWWNKN